VSAGATVSHPFWYKAPDSAVLSVQADQPLTGTLLQHEVKTRWPFHPVGLSVALLPGYALGGYLGALATVSLFAALLVVTVYNLLRRVGIQSRHALIVAAIMAFSPPISTYAVQLYPEIAGTFLLLVGLLGLLHWRARRPWGVVAGGLCIVLAPFFHTRLLPLSLLIVAALIVAAAVASLRRTSLRRRIINVSLLGAAVLVLSAVLLVVVLSERRFNTAYLARYFAPLSIGQHTLGILFDRTSGLLPFMPVLLVASAGFYWLARRAPYLGLTALGVVGAQLLLAAARRDGWEIWGPPARYILPAVPFVALALGAVWEWSFGRWRRSLAVLLAGWGVVVAVFAAWFPLGMYYTTARYSFGDQLLRGLFGTNPLDLVPIIQVVHPPTRAVTVAVLLLLVGGVLVGLRIVRAQPRPQAETAPAPELASKAVDRV
jgi:4-amino-4-deoxy-L-arabinose transferase-like glycosyltransferase